MSMASDIGRAMARLKHRDVRTRRRAVRTLFEQDDPSTLEAFEFLLDDEDPWFVSKALEAYRMWSQSQGATSVQTLLNHASTDVRRVGANLLAAHGEAGAAIALSCLDDSDGVVQKKAAQALLLHPSNQGLEALLAHQHESIICIGMRHPNLEIEQVKQGLTHTSKMVRKAALSAVFEHNHPIEFELLKAFFDEDIEAVNIVIWIAQQRPEQLDTFTQQIKSHHVRELATYLRNNAQESKDPLVASLVEGGILSPVARWLLVQGSQEDELRWAMIRDERLDVIERSKLLERLIGRAGDANVQEQVEAFIQSSPPPLLLVACENLSTAATELRS